MQTSEMDEASTTEVNMTEDQRHALFMKAFASNLEILGLRSPKYYEDKSQCISFPADLDPITKGHTKATSLKSGYIEPKDLIERLRQLKPSDNFELHEYQHPYMSWTKSPLCDKENPCDVTDDEPDWLSREVMRAFKILGRRRMALFDHLTRLLRERWKKIDLSIDRTPLPDLHLLKNMGSSPNGTLYPRYLVEGLFALRERADNKALTIFAENFKKSIRKREATISDWKKQHQDVKLNDHPVSIFRTWPSDLLDELDEIDRETARCGRSSYIGFLEEAEKQMQELLKFWGECGLITGQRTPPSPDVPWRDSFVKEPSRIDRESRENPSPSGSVSSSPTQDKSSQLQEKISSLAHKSGTKIRPSDPQNIWYGRLRSSTKTAKASCQTSRSSRRRSTHKPNTKIGLLAPRNIWDGRLRSSTKNTKGDGQTSRISKRRST